MVITDCRNCQRPWIRRPPEDEEIIKEKNYFHAFYSCCKEFGSSILLIIDNVEDPRSLNNDRILFASDPSINFRILELECNILFTTRRDFVLPGIKMHNINLLSPEFSFALLKKYHKSTSQYQQEEENYGRMICNSVGYLPLALVLIQAYLRKYKDISMIGSIDLDEISEDQLATRHNAEELPWIRIGRY